MCSCIQLITITMHEMKYVTVKLEYACSLKNSSLTHSGTWYTVIIVT